MSIGFKVNDVMHNIAVKFIHAFLPGAKKQYYLKTVHQPELDIHDIASKADVYNIGTSPKIIEEGLNAGLELIYYLVADGFKIKTPLFNIKISVHGEYDGSETHLPDEYFPTARIQTSAAFRQFIKGNVKIDFDGVYSADGIIAEATDEATGLIDECATIGNILTIRGSGLKIDADAANRNSVGLFFINTADNSAVRAHAIAVNEPKKLKVVVPALDTDALYTLRVVTQQSAAAGGHILKELREMNSDFTLSAVH